MRKSKTRPKKIRKKTKNRFNPKTSSRKYRNARGKTGKTKVFRRLQTKTKRKSARFYFRSRKPIKLGGYFTYFADVLSLDIGRGTKPEIISGAQVIPYLQRLRKKFKRKSPFEESCYAFIQFKMESGVRKNRTVMVSNRKPNMAVKNNKNLAERIDKFLYEGASQTKTMEKAWLISVRIKRFYNVKR